MAFQGSGYINESQFWQPPAPPPRTATPRSHTVLVHPNQAWDRFRTVLDVAGIAGDIYYTGQNLNYMHRSFRGGRPNDRSFL